MPTNLTLSRLREIAARNDPAELAAVVEMLADDTPVDGDEEWLREMGFVQYMIPYLWELRSGIEVWMSHEMTTGVQVTPFARVMGSSHRMTNPTRGTLRCLMLALSPGGE